MLKAYRVSHTEAEWRSRLTPEQFHMLREQGVERAGTSALIAEKRPGTFSCLGCDAPLFDAGAKYDSGTGWPSFSETITGAVETVADDSYMGGQHAGYGVERTELVCASCGSHLGHLFTDGPQPAGLRYCVNGATLTFTPNP